MVIALHVHTNHSACSESPPEKIIDYCRTHGIDAVAITDHNLIAAAVEMRRDTETPRIIVGEEISTRDGEVIGLFLTDKIEPGLSAPDTCLEIKRQGGLVYLPHPFDRFKIHRVHTRHLREILDLVDIVEVYNAKISFSLYNWRARAFAEKHGKVGAVGSDSHYIASIGAALNIMEPFEGPLDFLNKLSRAEFKTGASSLLATWWVRARKLARVHRGSYRYSGR